MKKFFLMSIVMLMLALSCNGDSNIVVVINEDGTTSNGSVFSAIDDDSFCLDYICYWIKEGHLEVWHYDEDRFKGVAKIASRITYKGNTYEVTSIGEYAFCDCDGLTSVTIPNSVTSIGNNAFSGCDGLTSVTIPNSVTSIGGYAFSGCDGLTSVTIPNSVTSIGRSAFAGCSGLTSIKVGSGNTVYDSRDNCNAIIESSTNTLISGCKKTAIPNSVTSIGDGAFDGCDGLTSVTIPNIVTSIKEGAFQGCDGLTSVTIPNSVTSIGWLAFDGCSGLTSVTIPNSVTSIGELAFSGCDGLTSIKVGSGNTVYDSRDNCNAIIESSTNTLISGCKNTTIPNSVTSIGEYAFCDCDGLTSVAIPNSVTSIKEGAFNGCSGLTSVTIPNSVTNIGEGAFEDCSGLASVTIPNSVTSIGETAFWDCSGLSSIKCMGKTPPSIYCVHDDNDHSSFEYDTYQDATLYVPQGSLYAYKNAKEWRNFKHIEDRITSNGHIFSAIDDKNFYMDFIKYTVEKGHLVVTGRDKERFKGVAEIPSRITYKGNTYEVTSIGEGAFWDCDGLTSVTIPNSVTSIGQQAFLYCDGLTSVTIPNSVTSIGGSAFSGCDGLTSVTIPNSVTSIGEGAFSYCGLTSVTIPNSVTSIGDGAFSNCSGLTSIKVGSGNTVYDSRDNCNAIIESSTNKLISGCKNTTIPNSVTRIGDNAFDGCDGLTSVTIPNNVTSIGDSAFRCCSGLTSVTIPNSVKSIDANAFYECSRLTSIKCMRKTPPSIYIDGGYDYYPFAPEIYEDATLYVPKGSLYAYKHAEEWRDFKHIVEE